MRKILSLLLILVFIIFCGILAGCGGQTNTAQSPGPKEESVSDILAKGKNIEGLSYDYIVSSGEKTITSGKMWLQNKKVRTEVMADERHIINIYDGDTETVYTYYPAEKRAVKITADKNNKDMQAPTEYSQVDPIATKIVDTVVYDGVRCKVMVSQVAGSKVQTKMWVREDYGIPARVEVTSEDGLKSIIEYKNMKVGAMPPDTFKIPAGVYIMDVNEMMNRMPKGY